MEWCLGGPLCTGMHVLNIVCTLCRSPIDAVVLQQCVYFTLTPATFHV